ncbi:MAG: hypothetical protein ACREXS_04250 [Gammaproteobacteria bacterium]
MVQDRLSLVLQAIWEPEFLDCSYGFRPARSAHGALPRVAEVITNEGAQWVVEADSRGFFDHVSHSHLMGFLEQRIADPNLLRGSWKTGCSAPPWRAPRKGGWCHRC